MPDPFHMIKDDGYRLCDQCLISHRYFTVFQYSFNPAPQYDEWERLRVYVLDDCYLLVLEGEGYGACKTYARLPFGSFAKSSLLEIAKSLNAIAPDGFGFHIRFHLSEDHLNSRYDIPALIDYDRSRLTSAHTDEQKDPWLKQDASAKMPPVEGIVLPFHTDAGEQMTFRLVAVQRISYITGAPSVGYARSSWIFFSYAEEAPYLLEYEYTSEWYPEWFAFPLSEEDVVKIKKGPPQDEQKKNAAYRLWDGIAWEHGKKEDMVRYLHPDDIDAAKRALYPLHTWYRTLTDEDIRGGGPLDRPAPEQEKENDG